jgi:ABC-type uncharacterized transport system substrate-binding protein
MTSEPVQRRSFLTLLGGAAAAWPLAARAQQGRVARIGFLGATSYFGNQARVDAFRAGLRDLGYIEGQNLNIDFRWAEGRNERLPALAAELVRLRVDVIVSHGGAGSVAAKQATTTIPIVIATVGDAVAFGLVAALNRPGGNVTGLSTPTPELTAKRFEMIKEAVPRLGTIAYVLNPGTVLIHDRLIESIELAATALNLKHHEYLVRRPSEIDGAFAAMVNNGVDAVVMQEEPMLISQVDLIAEFARKNRIASIGGRELAEAGGLLGYGASFPDQYRRAAVFVDKILKGAKPADLPVEQPTRFELILNRKTARALGIEFPLTLLVRADEVIE